MKVEIPLNSFSEYKKTVPFLVWRTNVDLETGNLILHRDAKGQFNFSTLRHYANYGLLKLCIKEVIKYSLKGEILKVETKLIIKGSLHKNLNGNNCNYFSYEDFVKELYRLEHNLAIPLNKAKILSFEFGLNIDLESCPSLIIDKIITYKGNYFYRNTPKEIGGFFDLSQLKIKVYNKGLQSGLIHENILRFEIHLKKMQPISKVGIEYLSDFLQVNKTKSLILILIDKWEEILLYDLKEGAELTKKEIKIATEINSFGYWENLYKTGSRQNRLIKKKFLRELGVNKGLNWHQIIREKILKIWDSMFTSKCDVFTNLIAWSHNTTG